ncbi:glycine cleavage system protein H [Thermocrinis minervae]|uniref:Glycine cleavage system H protein n=1 Tax=Thermocrinis minervae TaxID=381751 RepID=A0A1M6R7N2_9AQUI|nr:glycine cleavage system protein H [Thermocrinis minervae]SHK28463.1 glycine cleavage system H protein [Thermocrinis minervae]
MKYKGCNIPEDLYYDIENQVWYRIEPDGTVTVGATDVGQTRAGRMVNVRIKQAGRHVPKGKPYASLESGKWTGPVPAVIEGTVVERNEELFDTPDLINDDPYGRGWIVRIKPDNLERDIKDLVTGQEAIQKMKEYIDREGVECKGDQ